LIDREAGSDDPLSMTSDEHREGSLPAAGPIGVLGVGVEGRATLDYLLRHGASEVTALDRAEPGDLPDGVEAVSGPGYDRELDRFAVVFRSPGLRPDHPELLRAAAGGTRVTSALSHFLERCPAPVVGVTGTVGKGTCSSLAAHLLEAAGFRAHLGGNIGLSPLEFLDDVEPDDRVVLEISSFQAMDISISPGVCAVLRTTSEHLDWHRDVAEYRRAKSELVARQEGGDAVVYCAESPGSEEIAARSPARCRLAYALDREVESGAFLRGNEIVTRIDGAERRLPFDTRRVRLPGRFNLENVAAAALCALSADADPQRIGEAAESFQSLPHRLEPVAEKDGIRYVNDSYATRPEATSAALTAFDGPLALILGGSEKHADFTALVDAVRSHPKIEYVGLIGQTAPRLAEALGAAGSRRFAVAEHEGLESAVPAAAGALEKSGGTVLLSPACASFGLFPNYKVRGRIFRRVVHEM
jgi:UDP-N-acetylmuramoylalanine--D-glutamate ligase